MLHHILVKWNDTVTDKAALAQEVCALFADAAKLPGVRGCQVRPNVVDRPNRYDLMIVVDMDREALPGWDACALHHAWKDGYGARIAQKAIFDCD